MKEWPMFGDEFPRQGEVRVKHVPDAGSYAPVTVLVDERADGVHLSYDRTNNDLVRVE